MNKKNLFIITGGSKGLGAALVHSAFEQGHIVINVSRSPSQAPGEVIYIHHDMQEFGGLTEKLSGIIKNLDLSQFASVHLINNAAVIEPIGDIAQMDPEKMRQHLEINFVSPILLTSEFLKMVKSFSGWKTITNISSGAAYKPIPSWSLYCASKAGLKMFTENVQVDSKSEKIKFISFSPGVMDTQMQTFIRKQTAETFSLVEKFRQYKEEGQLRNPRDVAEALMDLLLKPEGIKKVEYDITELD